MRRPVWLWMVPLWLAVALLGSVALYTDRRQTLRESFDMDARILHRVLSQRMEQQETVLNAVAALAAQPVQRPVLRRDEQTLVLASLLGLPAPVAVFAQTTRPQLRTTLTGLDADLLKAVQAGNAARVKDLLKAGASADASDARGRTALTWAAMRDDVAVARLLIAAGARPDPQDDQRNNALLVSGETGSVAMLREILKARPDLTRTNRFGGTALIPAADRGHLAYVREILTTTRIDVNHVNNLGWTALLEAVILGDGGRTHTEIVRLLLAHGADPSIADREGFTPLQHARQRGYGEMVNLLSQPRSGLPGRPAHR